MTKKDPSGRLQRWALYLQQFDFKIVYKPGKDNVVADALSRAAVPVLTIRMGHFDVDDFLKAQKEDTFCKTVCATLSAYPEAQPALPEGYPSADFHILPNGLLAHPSGRIVVPKSLRKTLLRDYHDSRHLGGHVGMHKTYMNLKNKYFWTHMRRDVNLYVGGCAVCAKRKTQRLCRAPLLPMPTSTYIWQRCSVDTIGPLPTTRITDKKHILVVIEAVTKYLIATPLRDLTAATIARKFIKHVINQEGIPTEVQFDGHQSFQSEIMNQLCKELGIIKLRSSPFHPAGNGNVEKANGTLINMLSAYAKSEPDCWDQHLHYCVARYNSTVHSSTGESPFYLLKMRDRAEPTDLRPPSRYRLVEDENEMIARHYHDALELAHAHLVLAKANQKKIYDKNVHLFRFEVDDKVLKRIGYVQVGKFYDKWLGPYIVVEKRSDLNYIIRKEHSNHLELVHVNRLKKCYNENGQDFESADESDDAAPPPATASSAAPPALSPEKENLGLEGHGGQENPDAPARTSPEEDEESSDIAPPPTAPAVVPAGDVQQTQAPPPLGNPLQSPPAPLPDPQLAPAGPLSRRRGRPPRDPNSPRTRPPASTRAIPPQAHGHNLRQRISKPDRYR